MSPEPELHKWLVEVGPGVTTLANFNVGDKPIRIVGYQIGFDGINSSSVPVRVTAEVHGDGDPVLLNEFLVPVFGGFVDYELVDQDKVVPAGRSLVINAAYSLSATAAGYILFVRD